MTHRSAYPSPILPMDAHDRAFEARHTSRLRNSRIADPEREKLRAGGNPDRRTQPLFIRLFRSLWRMP